MNRSVFRLTRGLKLYAKGCLSVFGVLIAGFLAFAIFKGAIQPRLTAGTACVGKDGCLFTLLNGRDSVRVLGFSADSSTILTRGANTLIHDASNGDKSAELKPDYNSNSFKTIIADCHPQHTRKRTRLLHIRRRIRQRLGVARGARHASDGISALGRWVCLVRAGRHYNVATGGW